METVAVPIGSSGKIESILWMNTIAKNDATKHGRQKNTRETKRYRDQSRHAAAANTVEKNQGKTKQGRRDEGQPGRKKQQVDALWSCWMIVQ
jgi:hypothetical protein